VDDLLLKDYRPRSLLVTEQHMLQRARFPVTDAHNHLGFVTDAFGEPSAHGGAGCMEDVERVVATMDQAGVAAVCNLTGRWGDELKRLIDRYEGKYPGRFYTFANVDWSGLNEPGFAERAAAQLKESVAAGARGLKIFKNLGLQLKDKTGKLLSPDDPRLDPLWARAGELRVPVLIHVADDMPFFQPLDRHNEAYLQLRAHPEWHFYGPGIPGHRQLVESGLRVVTRHPSTTFIAAHTCWYADNDLRFVGEMLDRHPNLYTDISTSLYTLGRQPYAAREFFLKYQDRLLFGTDHAPSVPYYGLHFRFLETADEYVELDPLHHIYCLHLPDDVLRKVYAGNVRKLVPGL